MEAPAQSSTAEADQRMPSSVIAANETRKTDKAVTGVAGSSAPQLNCDTAIRLDNIDLILPPEIWVKILVLVDSRQVLSSFRLTFVLRIS